MLAACTSIQIVSMKLLQTKYGTLHDRLWSKTKVRELCDCAMTPWAIPATDTICTGTNLKCANTVRAQIGKYSTVSAYLYLLVFSFHSCLSEKYIIGVINEKRLLTLVGSKNAVYDPFFAWYIGWYNKFDKSILINMKTKLKPVYHKGKL